MRKIKAVVVSILTMALCVNTGVEGSATKNAEAKVVSKNAILQEEKIHPATRKMSAKKKKIVKDSQGLIYTFPEDDGEVTSKNCWVVSAKKIKKKNIVIPAKYKGKRVVEVARIGYDGRKKLHSVTIGKNVVTISEGAFSGCSNLSKVKFKGNRLVSIGEAAFSGCTSLKKVTLPKNVHSIFDTAFSFSGLEEIVIPDKTENIWEYTFRNCKNLKKVTLGKGIKMINPYCFEGCSQLNEMVIPEKVEEIGEGAFSGCEKIETLIFEGQVKEIGKNAFFGTPFLEKSKVENCAIVNGLIVETYGELSGELEIDGTQGIGGQVIRGISGCAYANNNLNKITIKNLEVIGGKAFENSKAQECFVQNVNTISLNAFAGCEFTKLTVENIKLLFQCFVTTTAKDYCAKNIGEFGFYEYSGIPRGVETVSIDGIELTETMPGIRTCNELKQITIKGNITEIPAQKMGFLSNLESYTLETPNTPEWTCEQGRPNWFAECPKLTDVYLKCGGVSPSIKGVLPENITLYVPAEQVEEYKKYVDCKVVAW